MDGIQRKTLFIPEILLSCPNIKLLFPGRVPLTLSIPGPMPPVTNETLKKEKIIGFDENGTVNGTVNENQRKILAEIEKQNSITYEQLAERLKKGRTTIYRNIKKMAELNIIKRSGSDKNGFWEVNREMLSSPKIKR